MNCLFLDALPWIVSPEQRGDGKRPRSTAPSLFHIRWCAAFVSGNRWLCLTRHWILCTNMLSLVKRRPNPQLFITALGRLFWGRCGLSVWTLKTSALGRTSFQLRLQRRLCKPQHSEFIFFQFHFKAYKRRKKAPWSALNLWRFLINFLIERRERSQMPRGSASEQLAEVRSESWSAAISGLNAMNNFTQGKTSTRKRH